MDLNVIQTMQNFNQPKKKPLTLEARHSISIEASNKIRSKLKTRLFIPRQSITRHSNKTQHYPKEIKPTLCKYQNFTNFTTSLKQFESIKKCQTDVVDNFVKLFRGKYTKRTQCDKNFKIMENINKTHPKKSQNINILKTDRDLKTDKNGKKKRTGDLLSHCKEKIGKKTYVKLSNKPNTANAKERAVKNWNLKVIGNNNTKDTTSYLTDGEPEVINTKEALNPPVLLPRDEFSSNSRNLTINSADIFKNPTLFSSEFANFNKNCLPNLQTPHAGSNNTSGKQTCYSRNWKSKDGESSKQIIAKTSNETSNNKNCDAEKLQPKVKEKSEVFIIQTSSELKEKNIANFDDSKSGFIENSAKVLPDLLIKNGQNPNCSNSFEGTKSFTQQSPSENVNETICASSSKLQLIIADNKSQQQPFCVSTTIGSTHRNDSDLKEHPPRIVNSATPGIQVSLLQQQEQPVSTTIGSSHPNDSQLNEHPTRPVNSATPVLQVSLLQQQEQPVSTTIGSSHPNDSQLNKHTPRTVNSATPVHQVSLLQQQEQPVSTTIGSSHRNDSQLNEHPARIANSATPVHQVSLLQQQEQPVSTTIGSSHRNDSEPSGLRTRIFPSTTPQAHIALLQQQQHSVLSIQKPNKTTENVRGKEVKEGPEILGSNTTKSTKANNCPFESSTAAVADFQHCIRSSICQSYDCSPTDQQINEDLINLENCVESFAKFVLQNYNDIDNIDLKTKNCVEYLKKKDENRRKLDQQMRSKRHLDSGKTNLQSTTSFTNPYNLIYTQAQNHDSLLPPIRFRLQEPIQLCNSIVSQAPNKSPLIVTNSCNNSLATAIPGNIYLQSTEVPIPQLYPSNEIVNVQHSQIPNVIANHFETQSYPSRMPSLTNNYQTSALKANYYQSNLGSAALTSENFSVFKNHQMEILSILHANSEAMKWNFQRLEP